MLLNKSVKLRLAVSLGLCTVLLIAVGLAGIISSSTVKDDLDRTYQENLITLLDLSKVREALLDSRVRITAGQRDEDTDQAAEIARRVDKNNHLIDEHWADYFPQRVSDAEERAVA